MLHVSIAIKYFHDKIIKIILWNILKIWSAQVIHEKIANHSFLTQRIIYEGTFLLSIIEFSLHTICSFVRQIVKIILWKTLVRLGNPGKANNSFLTQENFQRKHHLKDEKVSVNGVKWLPFKGPFSNSLNFNGISSGDEIGRMPNCWSLRMLLKECN